MNRLSILICCVFLAINVEAFAQVSNVKNKEDVAENKQPPLFRQWGMFDETFFELEIGQRISDNFGLLARSPDEFGLSERQLKRMVDQFSDYVDSTKLPIERKMDEARRKVLKKSKFAGDDNTMCQIYVMEKESGERQVVAECFKFVRLEGSHISTTADKQFIDDIPMTLEEFDEWHDWWEHNDSTSANTKIFGKKKIEILKGTLSRENYQKLIRQIAGEVGMNIFVSVELREQLGISMSQAEKLNEIITETNRELKKLREDWNRLYGQYPPRNELEDFLRDSADWQRQVQERLLNVLTEKQRDEVNLWITTTRLQGGPLFHIPENYGKEDFDIKAFEDFVRESGGVLIPIPQPKTDE